MRKSIFVLVLILPLVSCKKKLTQFYIDYNSSAVVEATVPISSPFTVYMPEQTTDSEFEFEVNDTRKDKIREILLTKLTLTITQPQSETFSFLNSIEIFISADGLTEKKVSFKENIPSNVGNELNCDLVALDLQEFIKKDQFRLRLRTVTDEIITDDVAINIYSQFLVDAQLIR